MPSYCLNNIIYIQILVTMDPFLNEEQMIYGYRIDGAMVQGWFGSYQWFVYSTTFVARGTLVTRLHCGTHEMCLSAIYIVSSEPHYEENLDQSCCVFQVMAGTGNLEVLRMCRHLRARIGPLCSHVLYGSHMAISMAIGLLFLGGGR